LETACAEAGITRACPLPLRGLDDAELTFSAVQALDPYLKHREHHTYRTGFIPQPVVRFTGKRDEDGTLLPAFVTSFVNTSIVQPIGTTEDHAALIDIWLSALSRLGFHTQHLTITGSLAIWHHAPVSGITLQFLHGVWPWATPYYCGTQSSRPSWRQTLAQALNACAGRSRIALGPKWSTASWLSRWMPASSTLYARQP